MTDRGPTKPLWQAKSVDETLELYADWADTYEDDVTNWGYETPARIATAMRRHVPDPRTSILDFGCGTGISGLALRAEGFEIIDGTDVSAEMIALARCHGVYRRLWRGTPGRIDVTPGDYAAISAMGVISLGAAPPQTLGQVLGALATGGILAFSYNDPTLEDQSYLDALAEVLDSGTARLIHEDYGPHLTAKNMNSRVYIIEKT